MCIRDRIHIDPNGVDRGSIFDTNPSIDFNSPNNAGGIINLIDGFKRADTGVILPKFNTVEFLQGSRIFATINQTMLAASDSGITIYYLPIN